MANGKLKATKVKKSPAERIILTIFFIIIALHALSLLYPLYWAVINALKTNKLFEVSSTALPNPVMWSNFIDAFRNVSIDGVSLISMIANSVWICVVGIGANTIACMCVAYPLARYRFPGRDFLYALAIFSMTIPLIGTGSTSYRLQFNLGIIDNPVLTAITWFSGFGSNFLILYGCFKTISKTYAEAAYIDGANEIHVFTKVMIPQAFPTIMAIYSLGIIGMWSNYTVSLINLPSYPNLALGIFLFSDMVVASKPMYFAAVCLSMLPVLILYASCQKTIMSNFSVGGIKG